MELTLEVMTKAELITVVRRGAIMPDEYTLAAIRLEGLEGEAVRVKESMIRAVKAIQSGGLSREGVLAVRRARLTASVEYDRVMAEIEALTERYFGDDETEVVA